MVKHSLLLFDIDQTLLDTAGAGRRAMQQAGTSLFGQRFSFEGISFAGKLDPLLFFEAARRCGLSNPEAEEVRFRHAYAAQLADELHRNCDSVRLLPGVLDLLTTLRTLDAESGLVLGLLTGNYRQTASMKLQAVGIDAEWFPITAFGDEGPSRPDLVPVAFRRYEARQARVADPSRVLVIGDTPEDVYCAKTHGCVALAVATGNYSTLQLADAGADVVLEDLVDAAPLFQLIS